MMTLFSFLLLCSLCLPLMQQSVLNRGLFPLPLDSYVNSNAYLLFFYSTHSSFLYIFFYESLKIFTLFNHILRNKISYK